MIVKPGLVLVEPTLAANVGSAARAVKTMGFARLVVVAPRDADYRADPDAVARATGAVDVLQASRNFDTLDEALAGVGYAAAMTGYDRLYAARPHEIQLGMGFAADYLLLGTKRDKVKQAGNAVTPPVARDIGHAVAEFLLAVAS